MKKFLLILIVFVLLAGGAAGGYFGYEAYSLSKIPDPALSVRALMDQALDTTPLADAQTENGKALAELIKHPEAMNSTDRFR